VKVLVPRRQPTYAEAIAMLREKHENRERSRLSRLKDQAAIMEECEGLK